MAKKAYLVRQSRKFNGKTTSVTFTYECEETEISSVVAKLDGVIKVFEENLTLSSAAGTPDVVTGGLPIDSVSFVHSEAKTEYIGAYGKPILFKASASVTELRDMFKLHKPFNGTFATETPDEVYLKLGTFADL